MTDQMIATTALCPIRLAARTASVLTTIQNRSAARRDPAQKTCCRLCHIQPGNPQQNPHSGSYIRTGSHEWPDQHTTENIGQAQDYATRWLRT